MKIIPKFAGGGGFDSLFTLYTPSQPQTTRLQASSRKVKEDNDESEKGKLTLKDLMTMMKDIDGLPNEMLAITNNLINTMKLAKITGSSVEDLSTLYLKNLYLVKVAIQNKKNYEAALKTAKDNGAMAEPAISMDGRLIVQTLLGLQYVTLKQYHANESLYAPLTVSLLANMRAYDPSLRNQNGVLDVISNSMGYEAFQKLLKDGIRSLGSTENLENRIIGMTYELTLKLLGLLASLSPEKREELLTGTATESVLSRESTVLLEALRAYLVNLLPLRMKTWAAYKLDMDDPNEATKALVTNYLVSGSNSTHHRNLDMSSYMSRNARTKKEKEEDESGAEGYSKDFKPNEAMKFLMGLGTLDTFIINPGNTSPVLVFARTLPITTKSGEPIGSNSSLLDVSKTSFGNILDLSSASVAGKIISSTLYNLVILNDGKIASIDYPYHEVNGKIIPDTGYEINLKKAQANAQLKSMGIDITNPEDIKKHYKEINLVYESKQLNPKYDSSGMPTNWMRFGVFNAAVTGNVVGDDYDSSLLREVSASEADAIESIIQEKDKNYSNPQTGGDPIFHIFGSDAVYLGTVWIPILKHAYQAASAGEDYRLGDVLQIERDMTRNENYQLNRALYDENKERYGYKPGIRV